jgi:ribosome-binding protein aMBF1 (putative translation factor)
MMQNMSTQNGGHSVADFTTGVETADSAHASTTIAVGDRIRDIRVQCGWSIEDLAAHTKMDVKTLIHIENGTRSPSVGTLQRLAKSFDLPTHYLHPP